MALRPIKSASISFGLVSIPVKFYTATHQEDISFNLIHESCGSRVNRKYWCPEHEEIIESSELIKGYQFRKGKYVTFTKDELESLETDDNRSLEIAEFLSLDQIDPLFFEKAYFLGPADGGGKTYKLLASAMKKQGKVALARWVSANREHLVILRPFEKGIILHTMFYADEVRDFGAVDIETSELKDKELKLAELLIDELTEKKFDPLRYKDEYRERVLEKIEKKSKGHEIITEKEEDEEKGGEVIDIMEALRRSLEGSGAPKRRVSAAKSRTTVARKRSSKTARPRRAS